jgi:hypothetical protein
VLVDATLRSTIGGPCTLRARMPFQAGTARSRAVGDGHVLTICTAAGERLRITPTSR